MKQTIIILIGHDTSGKSSIAKELSKKLNLPIWKMKTPKHFWDPIVAQRYSQETITQITEQTNVSYISDRGFPCDWMYSKLFARSFDYEKAIDTDIRFSKMNTLIVLCYKTKDKFLHDEEDKDFVSINDYQKMTNIYLDYLNQTQCRYIKINTNNENITNQINEIVKHI